MHQIQWELLCVCIEKCFKGFHSKCLPKNKTATQHLAIRPFHSKIIIAFICPRTTKREKIAADSFIWKTQNAIKRSECFVC